MIFNETGISREEHTVFFEKKIKVLKKIIFICIFFFIFSSFSVFAQDIGDVNNDNVIDIIDGLLVAQYYVGLNPGSINTINADVNTDNAIDIIDALLIARYYVGLISEFPGTTITPETTQTPAPVPSANSPYDGYTLYGAMSGNAIYLVDVEGSTVHTWTCQNGCGYSQYLLEDGSILCSGTYQNSSIQGGGGTGRVQRLDWNGNILWDFTCSSSTYQMHHDIEPMPDGNVLCIAWEVKTTSEAIAAGRTQNSEIWPDEIIEVQPAGSSGGNIVWEWHAWDHLIQDYDSSRSNYGVVSDHPELLDVNCGSVSGGWGGDWMHVNGISYNPDLDQIVFSSHYLNEFYVIDHSTSMQEAAGHTGGRCGKGGDFLYRWGCPQNYDRGSSVDQVFYTVHNSYWIPDGLPVPGILLHLIMGETGRMAAIPVLMKLFRLWTAAAAEWKYSDL